MTLAEQTFYGVKHVVVDIEGTTSRSSFVFDVMFPYATERFADWLAEHGDEPATAAIVDQVGHEIGVVAPDRDTVVETLTEWVRADRKITPLKTLQGLIWEDAFSSGALVSDFYPDALVAMGAWHSQGVPISVYSSGSVLAQRNWYAHTPEGDRTVWITDYFDTANAGPKREESSYRAISAALGVAPEHLLFCSDVVTELDAASAAGWQVVRLRRAGEPHAEGDSAYPEVDEMTAIILA